MAEIVRAEPGLEQFNDIAEYIALDNYQADQQLREHMLGQIE